MTKTNEQIACNNWEKIGYLKAKQDFSLALKEFEEEIDNWQSNVWNRKLRGVIGVFCWGDILRELKQLLHSKLGEKKE